MRSNGWERAAVDVENWLFYGVDSSFFWWEYHSQRLIDGLYFWYSSETTQKKHRFTYFNSLHRIFSFWLKFIYLHVEVQRNCVYISFFDSSYYYFVNFPPMLSLHATAPQWKTVVSPHSRSAKRKKKQPINVNTRRNNRIWLKAAGYHL